MIMISMILFRNNQSQLAILIHSQNVLQRQRPLLHRSFRLIWISMIKITLFQILESTMTLLQPKVISRMLKPHWSMNGNLLNKRNNLSQLVTHSLSQNVLLKLRPLLTPNSKLIWISTTRIILSPISVLIMILSPLNPIWRMQNQRSVTHGNLLSKKSNPSQPATLSLSQNASLRPKLQLTLNFRLIWISMIKTTLYQTLVSITMLSQHKATWRTPRPH